MVEQCAHNKYLCINPIAASISTFVILIHSFVFPNSFVLHTHMYIVSVDRIEVAEITVSDHTGKTH